MAKILSNKNLSGDYFLIVIERKDCPKPGQFYMLRAWGDYPVLSRPLSVFDADGGAVSFLYQVVGKGTQILSAHRPGDEVQLLGPLGNTIPDMPGKIALVGGSVGVAPLYLAAKELKKRSADCTVSVFMGFNGEVILESEFRQVSDDVTVKAGGFITDNINPAKFDYIYACGPVPMMGALYEKCKNSGVEDRLYISMENRMACGIGSCLVCSCKTASGNRRVCKDGPVFPGKEVFEI